MVNNYILTIVLKPELTEKSREELLVSVSQKLGKVEKEEKWGSRDLAYPINRFTKGFYVHYHFEKDSADIPSLDKSLKLEEDIIRYLLIRK